MTTSTTPNLWRHADFVRYWTGESIARLGVQVTALALPLLAVVDLGATPVQAGLLNGAQFAPYLLVTLFAGVWVDRVRPRPFLVATNLLRAGLLALVPALFVADVLTIQQLYVAGFVIGTLAVLYDLSSSTYLPSLVERDLLTAANSRVQGSISAARIGGPGLGGLLVQAISVPVTLFANAVVHLVSALVLLAIRHRDPAPPPRPHTGVIAEIGASLRFVRADPYLRVCAFRAGFNNLFFMAMQTVFPLFVIRSLGADVATVGLVLAVGAAGSLVGAVLAGRVGNRLGPGPAIVTGFGIGSFAQALIPLAGGPDWLVLTVLFGSFLLGGIGTTIGNVHLATLTQSVTPRALLGRTTGALRFLTWGTMPLGALLGGWLGDLVGLRPTLVITALGFTASLLLVLNSPVARLRTLPEPPVTPDAAVARRG
ncbi:MFS transporter [Micromonospora sp. NPDC023956]|uniref:MFS transporter n=1 Tax=Micromonospora sp. NPDC023956 TaxID=3155722 RepID=UPI0033E5DABF